MMKLGLYAALVLILFNLSSCLKSTSPEFDYLGQFKKDTAKIKAYLKANNIQAVGLTQGVWFSVDAPSLNGIHPTYNDTVLLTYKMRLMADNSVVDQSSGWVIRLSSLVPGIQIAMPQFQNGSSGRIFMPSLWAYQNVNTGSVPANSNLIFEFTLNDVYDHQLKLDTTTIGNYLRANSIAHFVDASGLMYTVNTAGTGIKPSLSDSVQVTYTVQFFPEGNIIYNHTTPVTVRITDFPIGACIGLTNLQEGSTATMYLPSSLANGPSGTTGIPGKSNLVFTITLIKVIHP